MTYRVVGLFVSLYIAFALIDDKNILMSVGQHARHPAGFSRLVRAASNELWYQQAAPLSHDAGLHATQDSNCSVYTEGQPVHTGRAVEHADRHIACRGV